MNGEKKRFLGKSIMGRLLLPIIACIAISNAAYTTFWVNKQSSTLVDAFENELQLAQTFVAPPIAAAVWDFNSDAANGAIQGITQMDDALFAQVIVDGDIFAEVAAEGAENENWAEGIAQILELEDASARLGIGSVDYIKFPIVHSDGSTVAQMVLGFNNGTIDAVVQNLYVQSIITGLLIVLIVGAIVYFSAASVTKPLARIVERIAALREGDLDSEVPGADRHDELGRLSGAVSEFVETMRANAELEKNSKAASKEQAEVVGELAKGLNQLAKGMLSHRITAEMSDDYVMLRSDFNETASALDDVIGRVLSTIDQIEQQTHQMADGTRDLAKRTENQAATLEETAAAIGQITSSVQTASDQAKEVETTVSATKAEAERGGDVVKRAVDAMREIKDSADQISAINSVIEDISFQTNLLALNAGVEAARAGDAGRGFAVVASEVRSLALRASTSASEIGELIDTSSDKVAIGVELVDEAGQAIEAIVDKIQDVSALVVKIAESSNDQATSITEINSGVSDLDRVTQQNASLVEHSSEQGRALQIAASELAEQVAAFRPSKKAPKKVQEVEFRRSA
ncbi:methyl-accepting chemotaxis protein [Shimia isoporae]|uniref:Methyl-accepting chemotaxis protein n=1 Tax=Shimia isoporae TaxID=647720 RepID=A0A4R1N3T7_9RHOB|nr:HAMP domain-containing methyl-accepting chemotaxis protein [Shimia isoporae]TCL00383.1 methyl-accepting chemotaxis protein [Shimia isoporae]